MATVLGLAMKISADASGVQKALTPVQRALQQLDKEAAKVTGRFDEFTGSSEAAARAQASASSAIDELTKSLQAGAINGAEFAAEFEKLGKAVDKEAAAFRRAAQITEENITPQQRYERSTAELREQLDAGRISQETFTRAMHKAQQELDGTGKATKSANAQLDAMEKNLSTIATIQIGRALVDGFRAISGIATRVAGDVASLVTSVNGSLDTLNDFSARTGIGVEALQGYSLAAKLAGVDTEQFGAAIQKLGVNIGKATPGDALDKSLRGINLSVAELRALSPEDQFSAIGQAISVLPTAADRAAAAVAVFGKQGAALAPLFREGAASIEELQARAERLGVIVSETQVNNVADMNDAFDLVSATVQGIVGQVIGNLAPAVTAVTDQFLKFVEEWSGAQGTGGTGIANAITDVLLKGAEFFAGIFDSFVTNFEGITLALADVGQVFDVAGKLLFSGMEGFRSVFNLIQIGIDALLIGFGKLLEGIGSWVSSDLEQFGAGLAAASEESAKKNAAEMEAAATNAANAFNSIFTGDGGASAKGKGEGQKFVSGLRAEIENARLPEVKVQTNLDKTEADLKQFLSTATDGTSKFLTESTATLDTFQKMAEEGNLTAEQIEIMNSFMKDLNGELVKEKQLRQDATDAAIAQADADQKRIAELLKPNDAAAKIEQDLAAVIREQAAAQEQLAEARKSSSTEEANATVARIAQLDQLQAKLLEDSAAIEQGFSDGFAKAFTATAESLTGLQEKAAEFGDAGVKAAAQVQESVARLQEQARAGVFTKEVYEQEAARQRQLFEEQIARLEELKKRDQKNKADAFAAQVDAAKRVDEFLNGQLNDRQRNEIAAQEQAVKRKLEAALNIEAIEQRIATERQAIDAAREQNDLKAARAGVERVKLLDQALDKEQAIADGRAAQQAKAQQQQEALQKQQVAYAEQQQKAQEQYAQQQQQAMQAYAQEQQRIYQEQQKAAEAEANRQAERLQKLNTLGSRTVNATDIRTQEGAALVMNLATSAQDPALIQQRLQTKYLEQISLGIARAAGNYFNTPVAIVGYSSFGAPV